MHHIRTYFRIMEDAKWIIRDYGMFPDETDPGYIAAVTIYETAFRQLIQEGLCVEYENGKAVIRTDGETFELRINRDDRKIEDLNSQIQMLSSEKLRLASAVQMQQKKIAQQKGQLVTLRESDRQLQKAR